MDKGKDIIRFGNIVEANEWTFAKTMPDKPHCYTLRKDFADDNDFVFMYEVINGLGKVEMFEGYPYTCFYHGEYKYWTMGEPLNHADGKWYTILINRAKVVK